MTNDRSRDGLEILSVGLLDAERPVVEELRALAAELNISLGWHYLLDLVWILRRLGARPGTVLDAGAGTGIIQWYLADRGWRVISVDRASREALPEQFRKRYRVRGLREGDLAPLPSGYSKSVHGLRLLAERMIRGIVAYRHGYRPRGPRRARSAARVTSAKGEVVIYNRDLRTLADIADESIDHVVSVSALEHNEPEQLPVVVRELLRVLRHGGSLLATLGASRSGDWFHEPSQGWCYSEETLRRVFNLSDDAPSNFAQYDVLFEKLRANRELRDGLARLYFRSGSNGMPWGRWNPQYQSVGVARHKE